MNNILEIKWLNTSCHYARPVVYCLERLERDMVVAIGYDPRCSLHAHPTGMSAETPQRTEVKTERGRRSEHGGRKVVGQWWDSDGTGLGVSGGTGLWYSGGHRWYRPCAIIVPLPPPLPSKATYSLLQERGYIERTNAPPSRHRRCAVPQPPRVRTHDASTTAHHHCTSHQQ